jgi:hypothetical protein
LVRCARTVPRCSIGRKPAYSIKELSSLLRDDPLFRMRL